MDKNDIYDLQIKISYIEDFMKDLNSVVVEQNENNMKLHREITLLKDKIQQLEEIQNNKREMTNADEAPPHY